MSAPGRSVASPLELSGCSLWLDALDVANFTKDGSGNVSQWNDLSGNARHATNVAGNATRPVYVASAIAGKPGLQFLNASDSYLDLPAGVAPSGDADHTAFMVCQRLSGSGSGALAWLRLSNTTGVRTNSVIGANNTSGVSYFGTAGVGTPTSDVMALGKGYILSKRYRVSTQAASNVQGRINAGSRTAESSQMTLGNTAGWLGCSVSTASANFYVSAVVIYTRALSDGEIAQVEAYLAARFGILPRTIASPLEIPGDCAVFLDAAVGVTQAGGLVSQWNDQSGNNNHFTAAGSARPSATTLNGYAIVSFDGVANNMVAASNIIDNVTGSTIVAVCRKRSVATGASKGAVATQSNALYLDAGAGSSWGGYSGGFKRADEQPSTRMRVFSVRRGIGSVQGQFKLRADGVGKGNSTTGGNDSRVTTELSVATQYVDMDVLAIVVYLRALNDGELTQLEQHFNQKYKLYAPRLIAAPTDIPDCALWLDTADLSSITKDGSNLVSQWADKSGNARNFTASGSGRPTYTATGIDFDGAANVMIGPAASTVATASAFTILAVFNADVVNTAGGGATVYNNDALIADAGVIFGIHLANTPNVITYNWDGNADGARAAFTVGQKTLVTGTHGGGWLETFVNGLRQVTVASGDATSLAGLLELGRGNLANYFDGKLLEVVVFNRKLSEGERTIVERYLLDKHGL